MLGAAGLSLSQLLGIEARAAAAGEPTRRQNSVIILWMRGGPSHIDMWDLKPNAPIEIRGEFNPISTKVPGIQISEHLPRCAKIMDKWSIIRSLHHRKEDGASHSTGDQVCFTGYASGARSDVNVHPSIGSVVAKEFDGKNGDLPNYVMVPRMVPGTDASYLGPAYKPFETQADPANDGPFEIPNLKAPEGLNIGRLDDRAALRAQFDSMRSGVDKSGAMEAVDRFQQKAWDIVTGTAAQRAFDLDSEPRSIRDAYGYPDTYTPRERAAGDRPKWSQRALLARRLVEAGVRIVTVDFRWWDTHEDNFHALKNGFLPPFDMAYSALIEDLHQRGMLDTTMVIAWGEIGRTPKIGKLAGRDHWPNAMGAAVAGGGIKGGRVIGATDKIGSEPAENAKLPHDVLATMYQHLGVDYKKSYTDFGGRPHPILNYGKPISELLV